LFTPTVNRFMMINNYNTIIIIVILLLLLFCGPCGYWLVVRLVGCTYYWQLVTVDRTVMFVNVRSKDQMYHSYQVTLMFADGAPPSLTSSTTVINDNDIYNVQEHNNNVDKAAVEEYFYFVFLFFLFI